MLNTNVILCLLVVVSLQYTQKVTAFSTTKLYNTQQIHYQKQQQHKHHPFKQTTQKTRPLALYMVPRYDPMTRRWEPSCAEEDASAGYPPIGSLIRQGPVPFLQRLKDPDMYDQAVLKLMANSDEPMDRNEAQGNMDAYLLNPNDWALQKLEEKRGAPKFDYANANMEDNSLILTGSWAGILLLLVARIVYVSSFGCDEFCRQYHW